MVAGYGVCHHGGSSCVIMVAVHVSSWWQVMCHHGGLSCVIMVAGHMSPAESGSTGFYVHYSADHDDYKTNSSQNAQVGG